VQDLWCTKRHWGKIFLGSSVSCANYYSGDICALMIYHPGRVCLIGQIMVGAPNILSPILSPNLKKCSVTNLYEAERAPYKIVK
jgi:hypothetical protein